MTLRVSDALKAARPDMRFMYISGQGSDAKARAMWARVKGETENELLARWGQQATMFRPGLIEPEGGIPGQNSLLYKLMYKAAPVLKTIGLPVVGTTALGKAMLAAAKAPRPTEKRILENADILALAGSA
ncbi:hypothetical protein HYH03_007963 [Edaphochlamys debaryana]|uniref:Uncharacterized protein n=1 Tax=Edaphochlamys debaryana TaxID=47281 RepID=A0A835Y0Y2_9CHLO|nr:hypothetical protein HYH03_007963 [Edaphochlamys debaryana]|eukprot:KAG2493740.1 hypothetical protein HYH03_007963 [Edaphochlamys debaryana]